MPNQPKTPITGFRLDEETKERLRRMADSMNTSMTGAVKRMAEASEQMAAASERLSASVAKGYPDQTHREQAAARHKRSETAVDALAAYIIDMEWPNATPRERGGSRGYEAKCRAAAILNGEAWAIRKTWPAVEAEMKGRSDWP